ncbi:hypothetical protein K488DRAFT_86147 [Vararia minispora EC-137]|uniref:Uncharacterized protein n=1 Tax=Vararia minispora EC-137 TaxID=1314806 RepID=A0ACB8QJU2_9AGAM|nr:hypothetical protein K488DRAFT_86147 [Vararia minispora EC-137]
MPKPTLYTFAKSSWSASARIARIELDLCDVIEERQLDFLKAENMSPEYIRMTPNATIPALSTYTHVYRDTTEVIDYMASVSGVKAAPRTRLTAVVHHSSIDAKFMAFAARNEKELAAKAALGPPLLALTSRLPRIRVYAASPQAAPFSEKYATKIADVEQLLAIYTFSAPAAVMSNFYATSQAVHDAARVFLYETLPGAIGSGPFVAGAVPGVDDFHTATWVVHAGFLSGGQRTDDIISALERRYGEKLSEKLTRFLRAWMMRESFKKTYVGGLIW